MFTGKVSQIRLNASLQQQVVSYGVVVDVDNTDGKLLPYMTAKLQFEVAPDPMRFWCPIRPWLGSPPGIRLRVRPKKI